MTPKKQKEKTYRKKRLGGFYKVGQIAVILGSVLIIIAAILYMIEDPNAPSAWNSSYTFGFLNIPILAGIIAVVIACVILWIGIDNRFAHRINLILLAIILFVLAIIAGNIGSLVVIIGAILYIFEYLARN
ncbi:MAG: hypothetical protein ACTSO7_15045 [Candidatus Heimdallarchaeota archaeon]